MSESDRMVREILLILDQHPIYTPDSIKNAIKDVIWKAYENAEGYMGPKPLCKECGGLGAKLEIDGLLRIYRKCACEGTGHE